MIQFLNKYKAFLVGLLIIPIFYLLKHIGFIKIGNEQHIILNVFTFFWGLVIGLVAYHFNFFIKNKGIVLRLLGLVMLFIFTVMLDNKIDMPDNPITFILMMGFWLGFAYLLSPSFIKKYWKLIVFFYGPLFLFYLYMRLFSEDLSAYLEFKEKFPFFITILPIPILFALWGYEQWKWLKNLKQEKAKTELLLLKTQINPHFFFNTLNNLYALTIKNSKQAPAVILKLSDMMRYTIYEGEKDTVALKEEIDYLENYIELHRIRYKKDVDISFKHHIDSYLQIAPLLYIILLENAFKHGVESLAEGAFIHIDLYEDAGFIYFNIVNKYDASDENDHIGIGIKNLKRRLSLSYPQKHELIINQTKDTYQATLKIAKNA